MTLLTLPSIPVTERIGRKDPEKWDKSVWTTRVGDEGYVLRLQGRVGWDLNLDLEWEGRPYGRKSRDGGQVMTLIEETGERTYRRRPLSNPGIERVKGLRKDVG